MQCVQKAKGRTSKRVRVVWFSFVWEHNGNLVGTHWQQQKPLKSMNCGDIGRHLCTWKGTFLGSF
jgi:hypothetical protein